MPIALIAALSLALPATTQKAPGTLAPGRQAIVVTPTAPTVGATVYDPTGAEVGTIDAITPQAIVIATGTNKVPVPPSSLATNAQGATLSMTKAELNTAFETQQAQAMAQFKTQLVAGATVYGLNGAQLGTIKAADAAFVTLTTAKGDVRLPINGFGPGAQGVTLGMTAEQLDAAMATVKK